MTRKSSNTAVKKSQSLSGRRDYSPYPAYKNSGIEWLGEIPAHWEVTRIKRLLLENDSGVWGSDFDDEGVIVLRSTEQTVSGEWDISTPAKRRLTALEHTSYRLEEGDLLITTSSGSALHIGKTTIVTGEVADLNCCFSNFMQRLRVKENTSPRFLWRFLNGRRRYLDYLAGTTTGLANLSGKIIEKMVIALPPLSEQRTIATFLDRETAKIDMLVEKQEQLIDLLQERRTALIGHVVTKGLDPNIPMKDSGIEWLGKIPARWDVKQLGQIGTFKKCNGGTKEDESPDGIPCVRYGDIYTHHDFFVRQCCSYISCESVINYTPIQYGDVLFAGSGETLDEIAKSAVNLINTEVYCGGDVILLSVNIEADAHFIGYAVGAPQAAHQKALMGRGITVMHIYGSQLKHLSIAIPHTIEEQQAIAAFLDRETVKIDGLITKIHRAIKLQKELRSALISAAVTGKIDVRQASVSAA